MQNDLKEAITKARRAIFDQGIPAKTLLGKQLFASLDAAKAALERKDREAVQHELNQIHTLLTQS